MIPTVRGCGFKNECGVIWFSLLLPADTCLQEIEAVTQIYLTRAVTQLAMLPSALYFRLHDNLTVLTTCKYSRRLTINNQQHYIINCILRIQCTFDLYQKEKEDFLHCLSRRLFYVSGSLYNEAKEWMIRKKKWDEYIFHTAGYLIKTFRCLKMALSTMSYEASCTTIPNYVPFSRTPIIYINYCRTTMMACILVKGFKHSSTVTQPIVFRDMLKPFCPDYIWPLVSRGMCYIPLHREESFKGFETWCIHIHGNFTSEHVLCPRDCKECLKKQPLSLFALAQLVCIKSIFMHRRARVSHNMRSPFFKGI